MTLQDWCRCCTEGSSKKFTIASPFPVKGKIPSLSRIRPKNLLLVGPNMYFFTLTLMPKCDNILNTRYVIAVFLANFTGCLYIVKNNFHKQTVNFEALPRSDVWKFALHFLTQSLWIHTAWILPWWLFSKYRPMLFALASKLYVVYFRKK